MRGKFRGWIAHSQVVSAFLIVALGLLAFPRGVSAAENTTVSVSALTQAVSPGEQFTASILVAPGTAIAGMQFDLSFNASLVSVSKIEEGNLFKQGGASTFFHSGTVDNQVGKITGVFGAITTPGATVSTPGTFANITFTAKTQSGSCSLLLSSVVVGDKNGNPVAMSTAGGTAVIDRAPVLNAIGNRSVSEGATLTFTIAASDPDGDALTYSASNLPAGATFNATTRTFSWAPGYDRASVYASIHFQVSDGKLTDSEDITITVVNLLRPDVNSDGSTNVLDMIRIGQHWYETGASGWIREDVNEDGAINVLDATLIGQHWTG